MKACLLGDPQGHLDKIKRMPLKDVDFILINGDLGTADIVREVTLSGRPYSPEEEKKAFDETEKSALEVVKYLSNIAPVYIIYGNVEATPHLPGRKQTFAEEVDLTKKLTENFPNVRVINNRVVRVNGMITVGGLEYFIDVDWVKEFKPFNYEEMLKRAEIGTKRAKRVLNEFGKLDILVCHQPPYGVLDKVTAKFAPKHWQGKHAGSKIISEYIKSRSPKYVFCGHIHEAKGEAKIGETEVYNIGLCGYKILEF